MNIPILCASTLLLMFSSAWGQQLAALGEPLDTKCLATQQNQRKLKTAVSLDRSEYFPGESIEITLRISNTETGALKIFSPYAAGVLQFDVQQWKKDDDGEERFKSTSPHPVEGGIEYVDCSAERVLIAAGETIVISAWTDSLPPSLMGNRENWIFGAPRHPGRYMMIASNSGVLSQTDPYQVVDALVSVFMTSRKLRDRQRLPVGVERVRARVLFLTSTKLPMCTSGPRSAPGRSRA